MDFVNDNSANEGLVNLYWNITYLLITVFIIIFITKRVKKLRSEGKLSWFSQKYIWGVALLILGYFVFFKGSNSNEGYKDDKAFLRCRWCKVEFVESDANGLTVWYKGENGNCYSKKIYSGSHYDFCTLAHCEAYPND